MSNPGLTDDQMLEATWALSEYGSVAEAARRLEISRGALQNRLKKAAQRFGNGEALKQEMESRLAPGFELRGYSQFTKTQAGEPIWLKTRRAERDYYAGIEEAIRDAAPDAVPNIAATPHEPQDDIVPWLQIGDAHIGMLASEEETGANFDVGIAEREICAAAAALIDSAPPCARLVVNDLGDGTHFETFKAETEASGHRMDFDTRYWKMVRAYIRITRFIIERALEKATTVDYIANQGNHSRSNDIWIAALVEAVYGDTGRVNVMDNSSPFIAYRMGETLVLVHHGDKVRPERLRNIISEDYAADWGETRFRYIDGGHVHHSQRKELDGCVFESWNNLAPRDKHEHDSGYRSKKMMSLVLRSRRYGETGRTVMPIERVRDIIADVSHYRPKETRAFSA